MNAISSQAETTHVV